MIPLLKKYSIDDDAEREELIEKIPKKQKQKLISTVEPQMGEINKFLDSFGDKPMNDEAIMVARLAELISELMI